MADIHDKQTRSRNMSAIRSKNTKPEIWLRKRLHALGFRYRLNVSSLPGKPDTVLPKYKAVIFVHGCFWHAHECHLFKLPSTRTEFWKEKLYTNQARDEATNQKLRLQGWRVLTVWECAIKGKTKLPEPEVLSRITNWIHSTDSSCSIP